MSPCFSQVFRFDPASFIKLLSSKIENIFPQVWCDFSHAGHIIDCANSNISINVAASASSCKHLLEPQRNVLVKISHSSCTCNGDHVGLLIKTGSFIKKE